MLAVDSPPSQTYCDAPLTVISVLSPGQSCVIPEKESVGNGSTTTSALACAVPHTEVPVTVYVPAASTVMEGVVAWLLQR
jgi:hypothetical protein